MDYGSTTISATGARPAQLMIGQQMCTTVLVLEKTKLSCPDDQDLINQSDTAAMEAYRFFYNSRHSACLLPKPQQQRQG